jgi:hypothetical protein
MKPKISVLVAARKDSKYLAKFLFGYFERTDDTTNTEILVMLNKHDTWNAELVKQFDGRVRFFYEDYRLGRSGLHIYFNDLLKHATGDWIVYFCEDHFIIYDGWDNRIRSEVIKRNADPHKAYVIVPVFDNAGAMNHIVSRGFVDTLGGLGKHGWIDSYINGVMHRLFKDLPNERLIKNIDDPLFHDFTHDHPNPMDAGANQSPVNEDGKKLPKFDTDEVRELVQQDADKLKNAIGGGR